MLLEVKHVGFYQIDIPGFRLNPVEFKTYHCQLFSYRATFSNNLAKYFI